MPTAHILHNPASGRFQAHAFIQRAARELERRGWEVEVRRTQTEEDTTRLAKAAAAAGVDALLVAGGDGTLEQAISGLLDSQTALGVLPTGTANVWAQEIGLPALSWRNLRALEKSASRLDRARIQAVDIGFCGGRPFLLWAGVGLDAFVVHSIEPRQRWKKVFGTAHYAASALLSASRYPGIKLTLRADGQEVEGQFLLAVLSNIRRYAGGLAVLSPQAQLDDGRMELWLFGGNSLSDALRHVWALWAGRHVESPDVQQLQVEKLEIMSQDPLYVQLDGEPVAVGNPLVLEVRPRLLRILVPESAQPSLFTQPSLGAVRS